RSISYKYLGCPASHTMKRKEHYAYLIIRYPLNVSLGNFIKSLPNSFGEIRILAGASIGILGIMHACLPKIKRGIGFRSLFDVSQAMYVKLWWRFRTQRSLWSNLF
ncbi:hypothetical protein H5410_036412, partial [Solanum commersonii]